MNLDEKRTITLTVRDLACINHALVMAMCDAPGEARELRADYRRLANMMLDEINADQPGE